MYYRRRGRLQLALASALEKSDRSHVPATSDSMERRRATPKPERSTYSGPRVPTSEAGLAAETLNELRSFGPASPCWNKRCFPPGICTC